MNLYERIHIWVRANRYLKKGEPDECRFTCDCLAPGQAVLDIGAHKGAFTYWMSRKVGRQGRVYAFEPQPDLANYLKSYADSCRYQNITVAPVALSSQKGRGQLVIPSGSLGLAHLAQTDSGGSDTIVDVPVETLDDYLDAIRAARPISFIKCDVELHELPVLRGATELLKNDRPVLLIESLPLYRTPAAQNETLTFLHELGYAGYFFYDHQLLPLDQFTSATIDRTDQFVQNYVFLHRETATLSRSKPPFSVTWTTTRAGGRVGEASRRRVA